MSFRVSPTQTGIIVDETEISIGANHGGFRIQNHESGRIDNVHKKSWLDRYLFRKNHPRGKWKPLTLKAPILGNFILLSLLVVVILEVLSRRSLEKSNGGGVVFASKDGSIPPIAYFGFLYLPTILAVFYSMIWSWVDLDVKRLEPWYQLSNANGASAENSLLLQYSFDFLPFIPIRALRRRHWNVFLAGTVMLMIFWVVTPLQSAIFNTGIAARISTIDVATTAALSPIQLQSTSLNANFMNTAYGIAWLGQKLPAFTAYDFAFLPFHQVTKSGEVVQTNSAGTWSATVEAFNTNLTCFPAEVTISGDSYTFSNGKGCTITDVGFLDGLDVDYNINYIGYYDNAQSDWALQNPNCSARFANSFLAFWASTSSRINNGIYSNMTALFCETSYASQAMYVTINGSTQGIESRSATSESQVLTNLDTIFNVSNFEYVIGTGVTSTNQKGNLLDTAIVQQDSHIANYSIVWPVSNMVGFAVGLNTMPLESLHDPLILSRFFEKAHQLLFSAAFSTLTSIDGSIISDTVREGSLHKSQEAILLVRPIAIAVEVALGLIAIFACFLWAFAHSRPSLLPFDPSSIADVMSLAPDEDDIPVYLKSDGTLAVTDLERILSCKKYYLCSSETGVTTIRPLPSKSKASPEMFKPSGRVLSKGVSIPIRPFQLGAVFAAIFISAIFSTLSGLLFLYFWSKREGGITLPSQNTVVRSLLENYAPTTLATLIEPIWTVLNQLLCLLQPFEALRQGRAKASRSVNARYTSLPPQLTFWRALKASHFLLAAVCLTVVSSNVLAVAFSTLINESSASVTVGISSDHEFSPQFNGASIINPNILSGSQSYWDHFYIAMSNISSGTGLPPWADTKFFYIPFTLKSDTSTKNPDGELQGFSGKTTGIGANVTCTQVPSPDNSDTLQFAVNKNGSSVQLSTSHRLQNGTLINCSHPLATGQSTDETTVNINAFENGLLSLEIVQHMQTLSGSKDDGFCEAMLLMGWVRATPESESEGDNITSTFISCTQKLLIADFEVFVDQAGHIIKSHRMSDFENDVNQYFTPHLTIQNSTSLNGSIYSDVDLFRESTSLITPFDVDTFQWHNDSLITDWMNSLLGMLLDSTSLVDPKVDAPNANVIGPLVEGLYEQLFALLLTLNAPHMFTVAQSSSDPNASAIFSVIRIFISPTMFAISISVISLHLLVAILYYRYRPQRFLPRMPTSIASVIAFSLASRAIKDFKTLDRGNIDRGNHRYGYGRFIGTDGRTHIGIERQRYVVPLESKNPEVKRRKWKMWSKEEKEQPKTWI